MWSRIVFLTTLAAVLAALAQAQDPTSSAPRVPIGVNNALNWRSSNGGPREPTGDRTALAERNSRTAGSDSRGIADADPTLRPVEAAPRRTIARVSNGPDSLPRDHGQVWRVYDISPYTLRVTSSSKPEQAIVDAILRETGYEAWHAEPLGFFTADSRSLHVYHTPHVHSVVSDIVDRFVNTQAESQAFALRVITIGHPNWRAKAQPILTPVDVQTQGVQAWLIHKEDAAFLLAELRKRTDFREHSSPQLLVNNGQSTTVSTRRTRTYVRDVVLRSEAWPGFENVLGQFDEGFSLELSPLLSLDGRTIDAVLKCNIDQLEKLVPVTLEVPTPVAPSQRTKVEVPQVTHCRLHERFRWPADQVLLVGLGVVATPVPSEPGPLRLPLGLLDSPDRADLLVFVESKGALPDAPPGERTSRREAKTYHGRY